MRSFFSITNFDDLILPSRLLIGNSPTTCIVCMYDIRNLRIRIWKIEYHARFLLLLNIVIRLYLCKFSSFIVLYIYNIIYPSIYYCKMMNFTKVLCIIVKESIYLYPRDIYYTQVICYSFSTIRHHLLQ